MSLESRTPPESGQTSAKPPAPRKHGSLRFRADIEGLRALAILLVLFDHIDMPGFQGGFIGVDVFFVISGFLITSLLADEYRRRRESEQRATISIRGFYERRARRILPASLLVIALVLVASKLLLNPLRVEEVQADALWATLFAANLHLMAQATDYFAQGIAVSPLQNYWSLAVEEQFYLVWPLLFLLITRFAPGHSKGPDRWRSRLLRAVLLLSAASLAWSVLATASNPATAYFSPFTRAWELGLGAALALAPAFGAALNRRGCQLVAATGLGLIVIALFAIDPSTPYPGWIALLPTLGTAAMILAGRNPERTTAVSTGLSTRPARFVGKVSYSLYLWHWPVIVFMATLYPEPMENLGVRIAVATGCVLLAWVSYRLVEQPFRRVATGSEAGKRTGRTGGLRSVAMASASACVIFTLVALARPLPTPDIAVAKAAASRLSALDAGSRDPDRLLPGPQWRASLERAAAQRKLSPADLVLIKQLRGMSPAFSCMEITDRASLELCDQPGRGQARSLRWPTDGTHRVVLIGNSHAAQWRTELLQVLPTDVTLYPLTTPGCRVSASLTDRTRSRSLKRETCGAHNRFAIGNATRLRPDLAIISGSAYSDSRQVAQLAFVLRNRGIRTLWIGPTPETPRFANCLGAAMAIRPCNGPTQQWQLDRSRSARSTARQWKLPYLDPTAFVCGVKVCPALIEGVPIRFDGNHLSEPFVEQLRPFLVNAIRAGLRSNP